MKKIGYFLLVLFIFACVDDDTITEVAAPDPTESQEEEGVEEEGSDSVSEETTDEAPNTHCIIDSDLPDFSVTDPMTIDGFEMTQMLPNHALTTPWEIMMGPYGHLWVSERETYKIVRINPKTGARDELIEIGDAVHFEFQNGLLGFVLHPDLGLGKGNDYVYASYTYNDGEYKQKIVRMQYTVDENCNSSLSIDQELLTNLPASGDHNSGRLVFGPDNKLYYTIGDLGANQFANRCKPVLSQMIPTQNEIDNQDWTNYIGKILRIELDGSIPADNPIIEDVRSHVYTYGHRNAQGLDFSKDGILYSNEHGPKTDDEINLIIAGKNYGWPHVAGYKDNMAYTYCIWASTENCDSIEFDRINCPEGATTFTEGSWDHPDFTPPISTFGSTVNDGHNFDCGNGSYCFPTIAPSSLQVYESDGIPDWGRSLLSTGLKSGRVFRTMLAPDGQSTIGATEELFALGNRYRSLAISNDGKAIYVVTDGGGATSGPNNEATSDLVNPGTLLKFEYID